MEKTGLASEQLTCSYEGKEYFAGAEICKTSCRCIVCKSGTWEEVRGETYCY